MLSSVNSSKWQYARWQNIFQVEGNWIAGKFLQCIWLVEYEDGLNLMLCFFFCTLLISMWIIVSVWQWKKGKDKWWCSVVFYLVATQEVFTPFFYMNDKIASLKSARFRKISWESQNSMMNLNYVYWLIHCSSKLLCIVKRFLFHAVCYITGEKNCWCSPPVPITMEIDNNDNKPVLAFKLRDFIASKEDVQ